MFVVTAARRVACGRVSAACATRAVWVSLYVHGVNKRILRHCKIIVSFCVLWLSIELVQCCAEFTLTNMELTVEIKASFSLSS